MSFCPSLSLSHCSPSARRQGWSIEVPVRVTCSSQELMSLMCVEGEPAGGKGADLHCRPVRDSSLQLQTHRREPLRPGLRVHQPHVALRVPPHGVSCWRALPEPVLLQAPVSRGTDLPHAGTRLGLAGQNRHQEGTYALSVSLFLAASLSIVVGLKTEFEEDFLL